MGEPYNVGPDGWIEPLRRCPSPNCEARDAGLEPDLLVLHCISLPRGEYGTGHIDALFTGTLDTDAHPSFADLKDAGRVSAHLLVERDGGAVQYVSTAHAAWHAGRSSFEGRPNCNGFSIGIELEGVEGEAFEEAQYRTLSALTQAIMRRYPAINPGRVVGHADVAPGRKTDPGDGFDWSEFRRRLEVA